MAPVLGLLLLLNSLSTHAQTQPTITDVSPNIVVNDVDHVLTIGGAGFEDPPTVTVGALVLLDVGRINTTTLTATLPLGFPAGVYSVTIINPGGLSNTLSGGLTVQNPIPTLQSISPDISIYGQETILTITGIRFVATPTVALGATLCPTVGFMSSTVLTATVPSGLLPGVYDLAVSNPGPGSPHTTMPAAFMLRSPIPTVVTVDPNSMPNNLDTQIVITGTGFAPTPTVTLGALQLQNVAWVSSTQLAAVVPWGLEPGGYSLTVTNPGPDAPLGTLSSAITIEQAIGVWTTGGPYGGQVVKLIVHPQISTTVYAIAREVGLYRSMNGGDSWARVFAAPYLNDIAMKPGTPQTLLSADGNGLFRSLDAGDTWQKVLTGSVFAVTYAPSAPNRIYIVNYGKVQVSVNEGQSWQPPGVGLPDGIPINSIAVHSMTETIAYAGTNDGRIYKTTDGGGSWQDIGAGLPAELVRTLTIDPLNPERIYVAGGHGNSLFHRSLDGGRTWEPMSFDFPGRSMNDFAFHPTISGTMYAMTSWGLYLSTDAGASWTHTAWFPDCMWSLGIYPLTGQPLYGGGGARGVFHSDDGGVTWHVVAEGMNALQPWALAASDSNPQQVYVGAESASGFASQNAGWTWKTANTVDGDQIMAAAADPIQPCVGYLGGMGRVYRTIDCGASWLSATLPTNPALYEKTLALAVDPHHSGTVYAGGFRAPVANDFEVGMVYSSTDGGATWQEVSIGQPISVVGAIAFDPLVTSTLYIGIGGGYQGASLPRDGMILKSRDGGVHWEAKSNGLGGVPVSALAIDPSDSNVLYLGAFEGGGTWTNAGGIFKSTNGGESWQPASSGLGSHDIASIIIDPLHPQTLYAGFRWSGLYQSTNAGMAWTRASGPLGHADTYCLAVGATENRTFIYVGTPGGASSGSTMAVSAITAQADETVGGGVYLQTVVHRPLVEKVYLPLILRRAN
jgi:photosystem II stability/assembly factor-like uncharacterized protein